MADTTPLSKDAIMRIQDMYNRGAKIPEISKRTGYSTSTISKYINIPTIEPVETARPIEGDVPLVPLQEMTNAPQVPVQPQQTRQHEYAKPVQTTQKVQLHEIPSGHPAMVLPDTGLMEPHEWLKSFLEQYSPPLKSGFIILLSDRARIRRDLPSAAQLTDDIQSMESGVNKIHHASYIAEIYEHQLREYLAKKEMQEGYYKRPYRGIGGRERMSYNDRGYDSIPMDDQYRTRPREPYYPHYDRRPYYAPPPPPQDDRLARLEDEMRRRDETERRRFEQELLEIKMQIQSGGQKDPAMERLEQKIEMLEDERRRKQEEEMRLLKMQIQQGTGLREQDVARMIEAERNKLTGSDIQRMIDSALNNQRSLSEIDLKYKELSDRHKLEVMKLDEKGKTRDTIANAVKSGFSQVGAAIARTASEVGTDDMRRMEGTSDGRNMWQAECPYCNELITAPLSAKIIQCPGCNRRLEVSRVEDETQARPFPPKVEARGAQASFTVEQPPFIEEEKEEKETEIPWPKPKQITTTPQPISIAKSEPVIPDLSYNAQCPFCNVTMKIPFGVKKVECPGCKKQLEVGEPLEEDENVMPTEQEITLPEDSAPIPIPLSKEEEQEETVQVIPERFSGVEGGFEIRHKIGGYGQEQITERQKEIFNKIQEMEKPEQIEEKPIEEKIQEPDDFEAHLEPDIEPEPEVEAQPEPEIKEESDKFICSECGKEFEREQQLKGHMLHHIREKKKKEKKDLDG